MKHRDPNSLKEFCCNKDNAKVHPWNVPMDAVEWNEMVMNPPFYENKIIIIVCVSCRYDAEVVKAVEEVVIGKDPCSTLLVFGFLTIEHHW